jgi:hypothetical protein
MTELKPCPFCGGKARIVSDYSSEQDKTRWSLWHECCEHEGSGLGYGHALFPWFETPWYDTEEEAVEAWNARAERTCQDADTRFNAWVCSECKATMLLLFDDYGEPTYSVEGVADVPRYCPNCGAKVVEP